MSNPNGRPGKLSAADKALAIKRYVAGDRPTDIANDYDVYPTYIIRLARMAGHEPRYGKGNYIPIDTRRSSISQHEADVRVMVAEGRSDCAIGLKYQVSRETVKRLRNRLSIASLYHTVRRTSPVKTGKKQFFWHKADIDRLIAFWAEATNTAEWIGTQFGLSKNSILGKARRLGLPKRNRAAVRPGVHVVSRAPRKAEKPRGVQGPERRIAKIPTEREKRQVIVLKKAGDPCAAPAPPPVTIKPAVVVAPEAVPLMDFPPEQPERGRPKFCTYAAEAEKRKWRYCHHAVMPGSSWCASHGAVLIYRRAA